MKTRFLAGLSILVFFLGLTAFAQTHDEKKTIAVGQPKTRWNRSSACRGYAPSYADTIADSLRSRLVETGAYNVVSRDQMEKLLKEHEMSMQGLMDPNQAKALGQFLQADYLMGVKLLCHPKHVEMNVNLVDVETTQIVWAKTYEMRNLTKVRRAMNDMAKLMKKFARDGSMGVSTGPFNLVDSKAFHDATKYIVERIRHTIPQASGTIEEVNVYGEELKVKIRHSGYKPWAGLKLKVTRNEEELGWVFLKKKGRGILEAGTWDDMSSFEEGDRLSSEDFEPNVAIGYIEDVDEGQDELVDAFRQRMLEIMEQADGIEAADGRKINRVLQRMGKRVRKKDLAKLHKAGVDLLVVGRFLGENQNRRLDFEVLSTFDGKEVIAIKRDRIGL
jgi:TolB-like protein